MQIDSKCVYELYILLTKEIKMIRKTKSRGTKMQSKVETLVKHRNALKYTLMKNGYITVNNFNREEYNQLKREMEGIEEKKTKLSKGEIIEKRNYYKAKWKEYSQLAKEENPEIKQLIL